VDKDQLEETEEDAAPAKTPEEGRTSMFRDSVVGKRYCNF